MATSKNTTNYHLDKSIVLFFIITILVTATVFAYKYINYTPCDVVDFEYNARDLRVGEIIRFKDNTQGVIQREWDFGDSTTADTGVSPYHTYDKPGLYIVKLKVNGRCESIEELTIKEKVFILDSSKLAKFEVPKKIKVGEVLRIKDNTLNATSWEWRFGETAKVNSTKKNPEYIYDTPGLKTITLIVNGDSRYGTKKKITVLPKEKPKDEPIRKITAPIEGTSKIKYAPDQGVKDAPTEEFKAPFIGKKEFEAKLLLVSKKKATAKNFKEYLCNNLDLSIIVNKKRTTFLEFCEKIRGKGIKIKELQLNHEKNNCIKNIVIDYKKTSIF